MEVRVFIFEWIQTWVWILTIFVSVLNRAYVYVVLWRSCVWYKRSSSDRRPCRLFWCHPPKAWRFLRTYALCSCLLPLEYPALASSSDICLVGRWLWNTWDVWIVVGCLWQNVLLIYCVGFRLWLMLCPHALCVSGFLFVACVHMLSECKKCIVWLVVRRIFLVS